MSQEYPHITTATLTQPHATAAIFHRGEMGGSERASAWPKAQGHRAVESEPAHVRALAPSLLVPH